MTNDSSNGWQDSGSRDCVDIVIDCVPDPSDRPLPASIMKILLAEREELAQWQEELKRQQADERADDGPNPTPPMRPRD